MTRLTQIIIVALLMGTAALSRFRCVNGPRPAAREQNLALIAAAVRRRQRGRRAFVPQRVHLRRSNGRHCWPRLRTATTSTADAPVGDAAKLLAGISSCAASFSGALLEGPAFFNSGRLPTAAADLFAGRSPAARSSASRCLFPLRPLVESWLEKELRHVRELRSLRR